MPPPLSLPATLSAPAAFAYDTVSARFVLAAPGSDVLRVLSEHSGSATTLVSAGWSGHEAVEAVALNRRTGDMWVVSRGPAASALHRFQLVSGRRLETFASQADDEPAQFAAVAVTADAVFVLDTAGRRIFVLTNGSKALGAFATLPETTEPLALTHNGTALFVSHATGLLRVDLTSRAAQSVALAAEQDASSLHSIEWHRGALLGIQQGPDGGRVVRLRLNTRGTRVTAIDVIEPALATAGALAGDEYYFIAADSDTGLAFRRVPARGPSPPKQ